MLQVDIGNQSKQCVHSTILLYRCNNRNKHSPCRAGFYPGYITTAGHIVYEHDVLQREVLVISEQTAFDVDYLRELAYRVQIQGVTFESEASFFNQFHVQNLPHDVLQNRIQVDRRRISDGYFLYIYLEAGLRHNIKDYRVLLNGSLEDTIIGHKDDFKRSFEERWTVGHQCDVEGCKDVLVIDGGLKPHRPICAAKLSGVKEFKEAGVTVIVGCPKMPINESKYCHDHMNSETPIVSGHDITNESRVNLNKYRKSSAISEHAPSDDFFVIESILNIKEEKGMKRFLVKWVGFPEEEATMEPEENIPGFIKKFYEKKSNLGKTLPASTIKHTKTIGGIKHHYLKWDNEEGDWLSEDFFKIINEDGEIVETIIPDCNTRKSRDKRVKRHTLGILIGASPCGIVRMCEELFGSEGVSQVYGICCEYLSNLSFRNLKVLVYDDVCHLVAFALKQKVRHQSVTTEFFSQLKFAIFRL